MTGIYKIVNTANGKQYVGSAVNILARWRQHRYDLRKGTHHSDHLQKAWNKYGEGVFTFAVLFECEKVELIDYEQLCIDEERTEYNILKVAGSSLGCKRSIECRAKMSEDRKGRKLSAEHKVKLQIIANKRKGVKRDPEVGAKISAAKKGKLFSAEHKQKLSAWQTGHVLPEEHKANISAGLTRSWAKVRARDYAELCSMV